jgi:methylated-DNA-[protein]-cysteine S-methyltransferase
MPVTEFQERVYALLSQIPPGRVTTYASLARALHTSPRAVGNALRNNPFAPSVPCHRCVAASGYINGYHGEVIRRTSFKRTKAGALTGKARQSRPKGVKAELEMAEERQQQQHQQTSGEETVKIVKTIPPSGINVARKMQLLKDEGVLFDDKGMLKNSGKVLFDGPWKLS